MTENTESNDHVIKEQTKKYYCFCPLCNKGFRDNYNLRSHLKRHIKKGELSEDSDLIPKEKIVIKDSFDTHEINEDHEQKNMEESWPEGKSGISNEVYNVFDDVVKQENPWDITSIFDLAYFCCPECDLRIQDKQEFVTHAATCHPWVR